MINYLLVGDGINIMLYGKMYSIKKSDKRYDNVKNLIKNNGSEDELRDVLDFKSFIEKKNTAMAKLTLDNETVLFNGKPLHGSLVNRIRSMFLEGFDTTPIELFLNNLEENPSYTAKEELYLFLENCSLPITADGYILAYKKVKKNYYDDYTGKTFLNKVGAHISMPRNEVDDSRLNGCSRGLHFASLSYYSHWDINDSRLMIIKINPKDVVAIPQEYNFCKGRCCAYWVIEELKNPDDQIKEDIVKNDEYGKNQLVTEKSSSIREDITKNVFTLFPVERVDFPLISKFTSLQIGNMLRKLAKMYNMDYQDFGFSSYKDLTVDKIVDAIIPYEERNKLSEESFIDIEDGDNF